MFKVRTTPLEDPEIFFFFFWGGGGNHWATPTTLDGIYINNYIIYMTHTRHKEVSWGGGLKPPYTPSDPSIGTLANLRMRTVKKGSVLLSRSDRVHREILWVNRKRRHGNITTVHA